MTATTKPDIPLAHSDRFFIGGEWVTPSTDSVIEVIDSHTEQPYFSVAEAKDADMSRAIDAARRAFDDGSWPAMSHAERARYLRAIAVGLRERADDVAQMWPHQSGALYSTVKHATVGNAATFEFYADQYRSFPFEETAVPTVGGQFARIVREPVGVVGIIIPWNGPKILSYKVAPALLAGCTVVVKLSPEAPGEGYILAEIVESLGLPPGVINVLTAHREVSEELVRDPRVDKISFTGSTAAGRRIGSICGERIARCTLELGGKSAAVVLDDMDIAVAAETLAAAECLLNGQACASLTRIIVDRARHDEMVDALTEAFLQVRVGDPFEASSQMGPLVSALQRDRVESLIAKGVAEGATLATGGGRPKHLLRGFYVEPTIFANVDNASTIAQEEFFGPVLSVIPADGEEHAIALANDSIYGLNASVFTNDVDRAYRLARRLRTGTVGHNAFRSDLGIAFGGFKQSGIGREGGREGVYPFLETKTVILEEVPSAYDGAGVSVES